MLKKLLAAGIVFAIGYVIGSISGFRVAVKDYVEDDAELIEQVAESVYPSRNEGVRIPGEEIQNAIEDAQGERRRKDDSSSEGRGFQ